LGFFLIYGVPAFLVALTLLALTLRFAPRQSHRLVAVSLPLGRFGVWLLFLRPLFIESWLGVAISALAFLAVGLATRVPQPLSSN
jgi:hypothetical protein